MSEEPSQAAMEDAPPSHRDDESEASEDESEEEAPAELMLHFQSAQIIGQITNPYAREKGTHVSILRQPDAFVLQRWNAEITAERRKFGLE